MHKNKVNEPTEIILADPNFKESFLDSICKIKTGRMKWRGWRQPLKIQ